MSKLKGLKILVIEDMQELLVFHKRWLTLEKAEFVGSLNGKEGVRLFEENPDVAVVILDMLLPDIHGMEVLKQLRELNPEIPIVVCSGYNDSSTELQNYSKVKFIGKPFLLPELKQTLIDICGL